MQFVPTHLRALARGHFLSLPVDGNCNDFSVGIEFEGADDVPYEMAQYGSGQSVCSGC